MVNKQYRVDVSFVVETAAQKHEQLKVVEDFLRDRAINLENQRTFGPLNATVVDVKVNDEDEIVHDLQDGES